MATMNVPPADLLKSLIDRAFKSPYAQHPMLSVLKPPIEAAVARIDSLLGGAEKGTSFEVAKKNANAADEVYDKANRFAVLMLEALANHRDEAVRGAASYLLNLLFPERLSVIQLAYELEAASGATFAKRLAQPQAQASVATLQAVVPGIAQDLGAIVDAASGLRAALEVLDAQLVDKAGRPLDPKLFQARTDAHRLFARFVDVVETFAYPDDTAEHAQARAALIGPYRRFLATNTRPTESASEPTPAPEPAPAPA